MMAKDADREQKHHEQKQTGHGESPRFAFVRHRVIHHRGWLVVGAEGRASSPTLSASAAALVKIAAWVS
jgi:hypothetical protein